MVVKAETGVKGRVDWAFIFAGGSLVLIGTVVMLSAASPLPYYASLVQRHFVALLGGIALFLAALGFNYQIYQDQAKVVYGVCLAMLAAVLVVGSVHKGHKSWINLGPLTFQPAELARIGMILVMAAFLDSRARKARDLSTIVLAMLLLGPFMALIIKQPDYSTALTFLPIIIGMLFCAGASLSHLFGAIGFGATAVAMPLLFTYFQIAYPQAAPGSFAHFILQTEHFGRATIIVIALTAVLSVAAWKVSGWLRFQVKTVYFVALPAVLLAGLLCGITVNHKMKGYQRNRFVAYVAPQADIQGAAYHVHQSQIAIGSGGLLGKGLFNGTQSQLGFLPERHTDFAYAVVGEEMGFWGTMGILGLYMLLIYRIAAIGKLARDRFGFLVCAGLATMFAFELVLNVGMCLGLMPVAGIPLPMISYGGSSLMITMWALGIVANIYSRRYALL